MRRERRALRPFTALLAGAALLGLALPGQSVAAASSCVQHSGYWAPAGFVSVKAYGAAGNGRADDTAAVQCAVSSGSNVWFPTGRYEIAASISLPNALTVAGESDSATPTVIEATAPELVFGETPAGTNTTRTGTITIQDLFFDSIQVGVNGTRSSAVLQRDVFSDSHGYISQLNSPATEQLILNHIVGTNTVKDAVFLHGSQSTDAVPISLYRTSNLTLQQNIIGLYLPKLSWLDQWPGNPDWTNQSTNAAMNPSPASVALATKLGTLQTELVLDNSQGQYRSGLYTGFDANLTVDSNVIYADPGTPSLRDHAAYLKGVSGRYTQNWVQGWPDSAYGGIKLRNTDGPVTVGANYLNETPVLLYVYSDPTYPQDLQNIDACSNTLNVTTYTDLAHEGIAYYENVTPNGISNINYYGNTFIDSTHSTGVTLGQLSPATLRQSEADAFTVYTSNTFSDTGQTVPISAPAGIILNATPGSPATDACSGLTVPSYSLPAYGS
ncbi:glycosyl hydrolase family 28-related protein [Streptomyces sp. NPDC052107]|uniref:glycosyl hydrolase family 28-related protein n=1 Tax=Streptomyces sp. NPDC052107 TaxID=3155632 RepID=UPI0034401503